jgi:hypothetical protein
VDLSPSYVAVAKLLAQRTHLAGLVSYEVGDLSSLPFGDSSFDVVWTQHVVMNIPERERLYLEFRRVLKSGGKLALFDVLATDANLKPHFPVPWAENGETSFLFTEAETITALQRAGFTIAAWNDVTAEVAEWFGQQRPPANDFSLGIVLGPRLAEMLANFARNIRENRIRFVMGVCGADGGQSAKPKTSSEFVLQEVAGDRKPGATGEQEAFGECGVIRVERSDGLWRIWHCHEDLPIATTQGHAARPCAYRAVDSEYISIYWPVLPGSWSGRDIAASSVRRSGSIW